MFNKVYGYLAIVGVFILAIIGIDKNGQKKGKADEKAKAAKISNSKRKSRRDIDDNTRDSDTYAAGLFKSRSNKRR